MSSSSRSRSVKKQTSTVTVVSRLTNSASDAAATRSKSHFVLTVELEEPFNESILSPNTRLTVGQLRRTIEHVLIPRPKGTPPYSLSWSCFPLTSPVDEAPVAYIAKGDGQVRAYPPRGAVDENAHEVAPVAEHVAKVPAGAVVDVFSGDTVLRAPGQPKSNLPPKATTSTLQAAASPSALSTSAASSPKRSVKNVSFIFDEAVVRAQEPPRELRRTSRAAGSPPRPTRSTSASGRGGPSGRLPLRLGSVGGTNSQSEHAVALPTPGVAKRASTTPKAQSVSSSSSSSSATSLSLSSVKLAPTPLTAAQTDEPTATRSGDGGSSSGERFCRTITPSPFRDTNTNTALSAPADVHNNNNNKSNNVHRRLDLAALTPKATDEDNVGTSTSSSSSQPSHTPSARMSFPSSSSSASPLLSATVTEDKKAHTPLGADSSREERSINQTLPYSDVAETHNTHSTTTTTTTTMAINTNVSAQVTQHASRSSASPLSPSMSSPAFGSFASVHERSASPRAASESVPSSATAKVTAATTQTTQTKMTADVSTSSSVTRAAADAKSGPFTPTPSSVPPRRQPSTQDERRPQPGSSKAPSVRPQWLISPLPIDKDDDDDEEEEDAMGLAATPLATKPEKRSAAAAGSTTATSRLARESASWVREERQLRFSESPPPASLTQDAMRSTTSRVDQGDQAKSHHSNTNNNRNSDEDVNPIRTARDVLRATERVVHKYAAYLPPSLTEPGATPVSPTVTTPVSPPPSQPSPALLAHLAELAALLQQHATLAARQADQTAHFNAEKAHCGAQHEGQMTALTRYVATQTAAWEKRDALETRRTDSLTRAVDQLARQEVATTARLANLATMSGEAQDALVRLRDALSHLPASVPEPTRGQKRILAPAQHDGEGESRAVAIGALTTTPADASSPPPPRVTAKRLSALATVLVSETAFKQDDVAFLAALRYRGAQQAAALATAEKAATSHGKSAAARGSQLSPAVLAVPVCRPPLCTVPSSSASPPVRTLAEWLASKPAALRSAFVRVCDVYQHQASRAERLTMDKANGVYTEQPHAARASIRLYDAKRQSRRARTQMSDSPYESLPFPAVYSLAEAVAIADDDDTGNDDAVSAGALAEGLSTLFQQQVVPVLEALMGKQDAAPHTAMSSTRPAAATKLDRATVLTYGATGSGKSTCLFGLPPAPLPAEDVPAPSLQHEEDAHSPSSPHSSPSSSHMNGQDSENGEDHATHNENNTEANDTFHFSFTEDESSAKASPSSLQFSIAGSRTTDVVFDTVSLSPSNQGEAKKKEAGPVLSARTPQSTLSLQFQEVPDSSRNLAGLTPVRAPPSATAHARRDSPPLAVTTTPNATQQRNGNNNARPQPSDGTGAKLGVCGWGEAEGVLPRTLAWLLAQRGALPGQVHRIELSAVDVYYEQAFDLLDEPLVQTPEPEDGTATTTTTERPEWVCGSPSPARPKLMHPSHAKPLTVHRTRSSLAAATNAHTRRSASGAEPPSPPESAGHASVWTANAKRVVLDSTADACHWLQTIADRRCHAPAPAESTEPPATMDKPEAGRHASTTRLLPPPPPPPPPMFCTSHVLVEVRVELVPPAVETKPEPTGLLSGVPTMATSSSAWDPTLPMTPLRIALSPRAVPLKTAAASFSSAPSVAPSPRTFLLTFADLAGSARHNAFTPLPATRATREGVLCVRRQLAAVRDVLEMIARSSDSTTSQEDTTTTTTAAPKAVTSARGQQTSSLSLMPTRTARRVAASDADWDPLREWPTAVPKLANGVRLTVRAPPLVVNGSPVPLLSRGGASGRAKVAKRRPNDDHVDDESDVAAAKNAEETFRRALRPWLPRDHDAASASEDPDFDNDDVPPLSAVDVPAHVHIPYYRSLLTQLLQPTLGPAPYCRTLALVCVRPCSVLECLPAAADTLQEMRKKARAHRRPDGTPSPKVPINEETLLATAQTALERTAPLLMSDTHASLTFAQRLNHLAGAVTPSPN